jgi:hypothetical protein
MNNESNDTSLYLFAYRDSAHQHTSRRALEFHDGMCLRALVEIPKSCNGHTTVETTTRYTLASAPCFRFPFFPSRTFFFCIISTAYIHTLYSIVQYYRVVLYICVSLLPGETLCICNYDSMR